MHFCVFPDIDIRVVLCGPISASLWHGKRKFIGRLGGWPIVSPKLFGPPKRPASHFAHPSGVVGDVPGMCYVVTDHIKLHFQFFWGGFYHFAVQGSQMVIGTPIRLFEGLFFPTGQFIIS